MAGIRFTPDLSMSTIQTAAIFCVLSLCGNRVQKDNIAE